MATLLLDIEGLLWNNFAIYAVIFLILLSLKQGPAPFLDLTGNNYFTATRPRDMKRWVHIQ